MENTQDPCVSKADYFHNLDTLRRPTPLGCFLDEESDEQSDPEVSVRRKSRGFFTQPEAQRDFLLEPDRHTNRLSEDISKVGKVLETPKTVLEDKNISGTPCCWSTSETEMQVSVQKAVLSKSKSDTSSIRPFHDNKQSEVSIHTKQMQLRTTVPQKQQCRGVDNKEDPALGGDRFFANLAIYFIPNDDIAPTRRARITKAKQYGARWVRKVHEATHIVVDKSLEWSDIQRFLEGIKPTAVLVNDTYTTDCVRFRHLLNPEQVQYHVAGYQANVTTGNTGSNNPTENLLTRQSPTKKPPSYRDIPLLQVQPQLHDFTIIPNSIPPLLEATATNDPSRKDAQISSDLEVTQKCTLLPSDHDAPEDDRHSIRAPGENFNAMATYDATESEGSAADSNTSQNSKSQWTSTRPKKMTFEQRFVCHQGGLQGAKTSGPNGRTIKILQQMCDFYSETNDHWRITAYRKAIRVLERCEKPIRTASDAQALPNIGKRLANKIEEIVTTDKLQRLENAQYEPLRDVFCLFKSVYGSGTVQARRWMAQGLRTLDDLVQRGHLTRNQRLGVEHHSDLNTRIPRLEMTALVEHVQKAFRDIDPKAEVLVCGSYRRGAPSSHDVDLLLTKPGSATHEEIAPLMRKLIDKLEKEGFLVAALAASSKESSSKWHGCCVLPENAAKTVYPDRQLDGAEYKPTWRRIDFLLVPDSEIGAAVLYFTGNDIFNRSMRLLASKKSMRLNQHGLWKNVIRGPGRERITQGELVEAHDERRIFDILKVPWREPHERWC
ncbi:hypothetical protein BROUX41_000875 [Berkeleyomyces rouxiae]